MLNKIIEFFMYKPKFQRGDIIATGATLESWETPEYSFEILELGKKKYRMRWVTPVYMNTRERTTEFRLIDTIYSKIGKA